MSYVQMYRTYLNISLTHADLRARNKRAPPGTKYCNGLCQDFRSEDDFDKVARGFTGVCVECRNTINLAKKRIEGGQITLEQFKESPECLYAQSNTSILITRLCVVCKQDKSVSHFEGTRNTCKACRTIQSKNKYSNYEKEVQDIETLKASPSELANYVRGIPKDRLVLIISHFKVGRKASDTKDRMIKNLVSHFERLQDPFLCVGGCGYRLSRQFTMCDACTAAKPRRPRKFDRMAEFEDNIDELVEGLTNISEADMHAYNKEQIMMIYRALNIRPAVGGQSKDQLTKRINDRLEEREQGRKQEQELETVVNTLQLNDVVITSRDDGYINATQMCKAGGKLFGHWKELDSTKTVIEVLSSDIGIPISQLVESKKGNTTAYKQGTWIHPDLAIQLAQWLSPSFALQVSRWVRQLAVAGSVTLHREECKVLEQRAESAERKRTELLQRREHHKFKRGPVFYIISDNDSTSTRYKVGIDEVDINARLAQHRTTCPYVRLEMLVYTPKCRLLEEAMLTRYAEHRKPFSNHEWIHGIDCESLRTSARTLLDFVCVPHTIENDVESYNELALPEEAVPVAV